MKEKEIRLVASDMDGTLLSPQGKLDEVFFTIFNKMHDQGVVFVAASGRQYYNLLKIFDRISDQCYFIAENGSFVVYRGEELLVVDMPRSRVGEIIDEVRKIDGAYPVLCGKKSAYIETYNNPVFVEFEAQVSKYYDRGETVKDLHDVVDDDILKVAIFDFKGSATNCGPLLEHFNDTLKVVVSGQSWLDISHPEANKGRALELIQRRLGVTTEQTMAFGDQMNDVEMMTKAKFSYAVENAVEGVKAVSNFRAESNVDGGVIKVLNEYFM